MWQRPSLIGGGVVLCYYGGSIAAGSAIKSAIEAADRLVIGTDITIKSCKLSLLQGRVEITDLVVHNPPGYSLHPFLSVKKVVFDLGMLGLLGRRAIIIEELSLDNLSIEMDYDQAGVSNCHTMYEHLSHAIASKEAQSTGEGADSKQCESLDPKMVRKSRNVEAAPAINAPSEQKQKGNPIQLQKLSLKNVCAKSGWKSCALGDIHYDNFTEEVGASTIDDIAVVIMSTILKSVTLNASHLLHSVIGG